MPEDEKGRSSPTPEVKQEALHSPGDFVALVLPCLPDPQIPPEAEYIKWSQIAGGHFLLPSGRNHVWDRRAQLLKEQCWTISEMVLSDFPIIQPPLSPFQLSQGQLL